MSSVADFVTDVWIAYKGKGASKAPTFGSDKYTDTLAIANRKLREIATDGNNKWDALFEVRDMGTISSSLTYELDDDIHELSDFVSLLTVSGQYHDISIVKPNQRLLYRDSNVAYLYGQDPKVLAFNKPQTSYLGASLMLGVFILPEKLATENQTVPPFFYDWLVYAVASELARNDPAKDDQFANLTGMANDQYVKLVSLNQNTSASQPNSATYQLENAGGYH